MHAPPRSSTVEPGGFAALELALAQDLVAAAPAALGLRCTRMRGGVALTSRAVGHLYLNRASCRADAEPGTIDALLAAATPDDRAPNFVVQLWSADAGVLERAVRERGLVPFRRDWLVLARPCGPAPASATSFRIARAHGADGPAFAEILADGLQFPAEMTPLVAGLVARAGWHCYLAWDGPRPVAAAALFVRGRSGMLAMAATRPSHRGGSAHDALVARRIQVATALGCEIVFVETGAPVDREPSPSLANLQTAGFATVAVRRCFVPPGTTWSGL